MKNTKNNYEERSQLERLIRIWGWNITLSYGRREQLYKDLEEGRLAVPTDAQLRLEAYRAFERLHAHEECFEHFAEWGAAFRGTDPGRCEICGDTLVCLFVRRVHKWVEMSQKWCREKNVYHGGDCYHIYECEVCHSIKGVDSSG